MDLKQEFDDVKAAIEKAEAQQPAAAVPVTSIQPGKVWLRHPHTGDIQEVDATPDKLVPLMVQGYQQVSPDFPATKGA
jgi:hypothetical protein